MTSTPHRYVQFLRIAHSSDTLTSMQSRAIDILAGACLLVGSLGAPSHAAQITTEYGIDFVTVGDPGNRATHPSEVPYSPTLQLGAVSHEYRISRTPVTVGQWLSFVRAYAPFTDSESIGFTSKWISTDFLGHYELLTPDAASFATNANWMMAARFANWLHNNKTPEAWAFESGVYDASTWYQNENGTWVINTTRSPSARFWIPTADEWAKAAFYAPDRYGEGEGGYWLYPNGSNNPLVPGPPGAGETDAGPGGQLSPLPVGSYPSVVSPWGLLDISGGEQEWTSSNPQEGDRRILILDTAHGDPLWDFYDRIDFNYRSPPEVSWPGFRLASSIPAPGSLTALFLCSATILRRRRVCHARQLHSRSPSHRCALHRSARVRY